MLFCCGDMVFGICGGGCGFWQKLIATQHVCLAMFPLRGDGMRHSQSSRVVVISRKWRSVEWRSVVQRHRRALIWREASFCVVSHRNRVRVCLATAGFAIPLQVACVNLAPPVMCCHCFMFTWSGRGHPSSSSSRIL